METTAAPRWADFVYGHEWASEQFHRSIVRRRVRHAYLILGVEGVGKETLARTFAMALNCLHGDIEARPCGECSSCRRILSGNHPDVLYSQTDGAAGLLKIEEIRRMAGLTALKPFEARTRVAIFRDFDHAQERAQDALLKTLEEPSPHAILILLAVSSEAILPTIKSRCQLVRLAPVPMQTIEAALRERCGIEARQAALLARLCGGRIGWALRAREDPDLLAQRETRLLALETLLQQGRIERFGYAEELAKDRAGLIELLELWQSYWRDLLLIAEGTGLEIANLDRREALEKLAHFISADDARRALVATRALIDTLSTNANIRLALEVLLLEYPKIR